MRKRWLESISDGQFEEVISHLRIYRSNSASFAGSGRFICQQDGRIQIEGVTLCDVASSCSIVNEMLAPGPSGRLFTTDQMWRVEGKLAQRQWTLKAKRLVSHPSISFLEPQPVAMWKLSPYEVHFEEKISHALPIQIEGIISPCPSFLWTKSSVIKDNNPFFGWTSDKTDWFEMSVRDVTFYIRDSGNGTARMRCVQKGMGFLSLYRWSNAFLTSLSFLYGQRIEWIGFQAYTNKMLYLLRNVVAPRVAEFPPIGSRLDPSKGSERESLLTCATEFFCMAKSRRVEMFLSLYWGSLTGFLPAQALLMASVLEGLLRSIKEHEPTASAAGSADLDREISVVEKCLIEQNEMLSERFIKRVNGMLNSFRKQRGKDILMDIQGGKYFSIAEAEVEAWNKIRGRGRD
jgi:hypothetical protein